jgi:PEP-CTERM motif
MATFVFAFLLATSCRASVLGFNGDYDYSTWTSTNTLGNATHSSIDPTQQTLTLYEPDESYTGGMTYTDGAQSFLFSHTVVQSGTVSFDWAFNWDDDPCCSGLDFYVNGQLYNLANGSPVDPYNAASGDASGMFSIAVDAGDTISFDAFSADGCCGAAVSTITDFDVVGIPEPPTLLLLGAGLIGLAAVRRRRIGWGL